MGVTEKVYKKTDKKKKRGERANKLRYGLPGTDDQFVLARVKGQLWVIHRALCLEPEDPRLHLCQRHRRTQQQLANESAEFMGADDRCVDELAAFKGLQ